MSNKQLRYIILIGLFAAPFVPLIVSSSLFFPFITGKAFVFRLIVEIVFGCYIILALREPEYRPKFSWVLGALITFLVVMGLADIFAVNPFKAFWSNYERMEGYSLLLHLGAYFVVLGSVLKTRRIWDGLLATSLGASVIMSLYSFLQLGGKIAINQGGVRVDGTLGNAAYLGIYMVFHIFFAALLFLRSEKTWQKVLLTIVAVLDLMVLYFTATRGAILGLLGGAFITFLVLLFRSEKGSKIRKMAVACVVALIVFVALFFVVKDTAFVKNNKVLGRFSTLSFAEIKTQGRYYVWPMAFKGFLEKPVLGWGQEGFNFVFNEYYNPKMYNQEPWFDRAHSTPLDWLVAGGALGLISYLFIFLAVLYYVFKSKDESLSKNEKAVVLGLLAAYFFNNIFVFDQIASYILFFTVIAYVHAFAPETKWKIWDNLATKLSGKIESNKPKPIIEAIVLLVILFIIYFVVYLPWRQNKDLLNVLRFNNEGKVASIEAYKKPLEVGGMGFSESLEHISQTAMGLVNSPNVSSEIKQQLFDELDKSFKKQLERAPSDARYRIFYATFLSRYGWYGRALEQLAFAQKLSPQKQQIYFEIVSNSLLDNKAAQALTAAKIAYELEPSYEEAKFVYGIALLAVGDRQASEILGSMPESKIVFDDRYVTILLVQKQYGQIVDVMKRRIELDPTNLQHRVSLTAAYLQAERRPEAIQTIRELIKLQPSFKDKGEYYINEIMAGRNP